LDQTVLSQLAVFVASLAAVEKLREEQSDLVDRITGVAGFSVGEYCALVISGVFSFQDGSIISSFLRIVQ
jgi:[acyl-carrier-protein] S-malonyltransferase